VFKVSLQSAFGVEAPCSLTDEEKAAVLGGKPTVEKLCRRLKRGSYKKVVIRTSSLKLVHEFGMVQPYRSSSNHWAPEDHRVFFLVVFRYFVYVFGGHVVCVWMYGTRVGYLPYCACSPFTSCGFQAQGDSTKRWFLFADWSIDVVTVNKQDVGSVQQWSHHLKKLR